MIVDGHAGSGKEKGREEGEKKGRERSIMRTYRNLIEAHGDRRRQFFSGTVNSCTWGLPAGLRETSRKGAHAEALSIASFTDKITIRQVGNRDRATGPIS